MGFDAFKDKISDKIDEVRGNEEQTDNALGQAENFINEKTGDKYADQVGQGRDFLDGKVGEGENPPAGGDNA